MLDLRETIALLALANEKVFIGKSKGYNGDAFIVGEVVFNTAMTGYQEIITDPSYQEQIINFTHPHIGNVGTNPLDGESMLAFSKAIIARKISDHSSNWRAEQSLPEFLQHARVAALDEVDTRAITHCIREQGAINGCIAIVPAGESVDSCAQQAIARAKSYAGLSGAQLAHSASKRLQFSREWTESVWESEENSYTSKHAPHSFHVIVLDCGCKRNILRSLTSRGCKVTVLPYDVATNDVLALSPDGVLFSNGPGDPSPCLEAIELAKKLMAQNIPLFGLCLGHQIIALALGAQVEKMKFGHHGANHPVRTQDGRVLITSQNHGFAIRPETLPANAQVTHRSLFDQSLQGIRMETPPVLTFQGHPEASPGPHDGGELFDDFIRMIKNSA